MTCWRHNMFKDCVARQSNIHKIREMVYLTEMHKITILQMIGYEDRTRTQAEVVRLFQEKYPELPPISQGTVIFGFAYKMLTGMVYRIVYPKVTLIIWFRVSLTD
ncbi:hypothetical protein NQ318_014228 [Aromia moschata]|uniref:DUF4817 domain-containing protein n=1 Tax=Aromia moschata TaxID=1265417 RepID=A0AAV8YXS3_9CUCU|nr:hypothetical protein NQ318_014228 [Aromia moschata]